MSFCKQVCFATSHLRRCGGAGLLFCPPSLIFPHPVACPPHPRYFCSINSCTCSVTLFVSDGFNNAHAPHMGCLYTACDFLALLAWVFRLSPSRCSTSNCWNLKSNWMPSVRANDLNTKRRCRNPSHSIKSTSPPFLPEPPQQQTLPRAHITCTTLMLTILPTQRTCALRCYAVPRTRTTFPRPHSRLLATEIIVGRALVLRRVAISRAVLVAWIEERHMSPTPFCFYVWCGAQEPAHSHIHRSGTRAGGPRFLDFESRRKADGPPLHHGTTRHLLCAHVLRSTGCTAHLPCSCCMPVWA